MKRAANEVRIADLKAHLSEHLRKVRRGQTLVVYDRDTPIARVLPYEDARGALQIRPATLDPKDVHLPPPPKMPVDSLAALLEDRNRDRNR